VRATFLPRSIVRICGPEKLRAHSKTTPPSAAASPESTPNARVPDQATRLPAQIPCVPPDFDTC
jgi:hypothetical protein